MSLMFSRGRQWLEMGSFALLWVAASSIVEAQPDERILAYAQQHFEQGVEQYGTGAFGEALESFRASFAIHASPNSSLYMARCLRGLGRLGEAVSTYEETVRIARRRSREDARYDDTVAAAEQEAGVLEPQVGRVVVRAADVLPSTVLTVGDRRLPLAALGLPVAVMPGTHGVRLTAPGAPDRDATVVVRRGETSTVDLPSSEVGSQAPPVVSEPAVSAEISRPADESVPGGVFAGLISSGVIAVAGWTVFAIFAAMAGGQFDDLEAACGDGPCAPEFQDDVDRGRNLELGANIGLVSGAVGTAAAVFFTVWAVQSSPGPPESGVALYPGGVRGWF